MLNLDEVKTSADFVATAAALRPRLGRVLNWNEHSDEKEMSLAREFMNAKGVQHAIIYRALFVAVTAAFERFCRRLIETALQTRVADIPYDRIEETLGTQNRKLTGRILSTIDSPRDHLTFNYDDLITNLASCRKNAARFKLNEVAFSSVVTTSSPHVLERALKNIDVENWWDEVGTDSDLRLVLGTRKTRETSNQAERRLAELSRWRNLIAHAGDESLEVSMAQFNDAVAFIRAFSKALWKAVLNSCATRSP